MEMFLKLAKTGPGQTVCFKVLSLC
eukprot:COSAG06_NODE_55204_length_290_cov_2.094241_1_plen_24_part_10